ncbi:hypothetical protein SAMN05421830_1056 [Desulfomicrobium norvegicum]|uniref:Uncharacterized protein n=1 Tax=Desulfomicrobium norvegicum (strain DSM 1741 / NCIMB 8310) TaxID=52561 RepID=A0A8G2F7W0_DESNO|nr:hypothetical protein [Desulfomicrobium norvegicum]SFL69396.1 hypothetical protein SAMN05421830_1056 [Desulfomicrobium norvegicum]
MISPNERPSCEAVLDAFAVENNPDRFVLERYLELYPEYANKLIDLSLELSCEAYEDTEPLSVADQSLIDAAWSLHAASIPKEQLDPFASLTVDDLRNIARQLNMPRQVITALRERRVSLGSIPRKFLQQFAALMNSSIPQLELAWRQPCPCGMRSYKSDDKPTTGKQVSFEQIMIDAGVPVEKIARILSEID